jgi:hypothetical protein
MNTFTFALISYNINEKTRIISYCSTIGYLHDGVDFSLRSTIPKVDISTVSTELKVQRFESDLFGMDIERPAESIAKLKAEYGDFFDLYMFRITSLGTPDSIMMQERIVSFVSDTNFRAVANDIR